MRSLPVLALSLAAVVLVAACSSGSAASPAPSASPPPASPAPAAPTAADLDGNTYIVTGVQGHDLVEGSEIALRFDGGQPGHQRRLQPDERRLHDHGRQARRSAP